MALALIAIGLLLVISAAQNTQGVLFSTLKSDFTGSDSFLQWIAAIFLVGAIGFIPKMRGFSMALLALVLLGIFLKKGTGFFDQWTKAISGNAGSVASGTTITA